MIGGEGQLQAVLGHLTLAEHRAGIVDQHVDARLGRRRFPWPAGSARPGAKHRRNERCASSPGAISRNRRQRGLAPAFAARHQDDARAHRGQSLRRYLSDARGAAGNNHYFSLHGCRQCTLSGDAHRSHLHGGIAVVGVPQERSAEGSRSSGSLPRRSFKHRRAILSWRRTAPGRRTEWTASMNWSG